MVPFIAARTAPIAPLGSPNASKLHSTRPRCWTHLPKQAVQVTAGFLQGRAFCRNARAESLCVIQSTCTRAGRGTYACEELVGSLNQEDPVASSGAFNNAERVCVTCITLAHDDAHQGMLAPVPQQLRSERGICKETHT